jgi:MEDS: MEthanogen/methylotroph, DcmR Sensory domain
MPEAGTSDHVCCVHDDPAALDRAVQEFLAGGLARGERLLCVGERIIDSLPNGALSSAEIAALVADGTLETLTLAEAFEATGPFLAENQLSYYETATRRAIDAGYRGLRVIAEVSALAADPAVRPGLVTWELVADDYIARGTGFTAMCAYSGRLAAEALADVAAVHPLVHGTGDAPGFRIFFDDDRIVLAGSVDTFSADRLARVLASSPLDAVGGVLDLRLTEFLDVAACRVLARWAGDLRDRALPLEVWNAGPLLQRMWRLLALDDVAPVEFARSAA